MRRGLLFLLGVGVLLGSGFEAFADSVKVAVYYRPPSMMLLDVEAELKTGGFLPLLIPEEDDSIPLSKAAAEAGTDAAIRILSNGRGVAVFVADPSRRMFLSTNVTAQETEGREGAVLAIKAVEAVRVGLMQILDEERQKAPPPPPVAAAKAPPSSPATVPPRPSKERVLTAVMPSATFGFGDIPPAFQIALDLTVKPVQRLRLFVFGLMPTAASTLHSSVGSAHIRMGFVAVGLSVDVGKTDGRVSPHVGMMGGAWFLSVKGRASLPFYSEDTSGVVGAAASQIGAAVRLTRIVSLRGDVLLGVTFPEPLIRFEGKRVGSFGRPLLCGTLGIEITLGSSSE